MGGGWVRWGVASLMIWEGLVAYLVILKIIEGGPINFC